MTIKEAIEYWEQFKAETDDLYDTCSDVERDILAKQREVAEFTISALRAKQEKPSGSWISAEDRLPEAGGYVVCIAKRNPFSRFMPMVARIEKNGWVNPITEQYISEVTNWMQLPDPPQEV